MPRMIEEPRLFPHGWTSGRIGRNARLDCVPLGAIFRISPVSAMLIYILPRRSIWMLSGVSNAAGLNRATVSAPCADPLWAATQMVDIAASAATATKFANMFLRFIVTLLLYG